MKIVPINEAYERVFKRREGIPRLEVHAAGGCAHIGKISPACLACFVPDEFHVNMTPCSDPYTAYCNANCIYCTDDRAARQPLVVEEPKFMDEGSLQDWEDELVAGYNFQKQIIPILSFSGAGEPILQPKILEEVIGFYKERIEPAIGVPVWVKIYTNGIAFDKKMAKWCKKVGFDEIRFHLGATNFSDQVYENIEMTSRYIDTVAIETPSWPPHRAKLFEMLGKAEELGIKHVNMGQIELTETNKFTISQAYPEAEIFQVGSWVLDDGGLVYDLMREVAERDYSYSILDCSGFVKQVQRGGIPTNRAVNITYDGIGLKGMIDWELYDKKKKALKLTLERNSG